VSLLPIVPFVLMLLAIALLPLVATHWWESNANKARVASSWVCRSLAISSCKGRQGGTMSAHPGRVCGIYRATKFPLHDLRRYCSTRRPASYPSSEQLFPGARGRLGSIMGTTGASMLLIRPLLQTNAERRYVAHTWCSLFSCQ